MEKIAKPSLPIKLLLWLAAALWLAGCAAHHPKSSATPTLAAAPAGAGEEDTAAEEEIPTGEEALIQSGVPDAEAERYIAVEDPFSMEMGIADDNQDFLRALSVRERDPLCKAKADPLTQAQEKFSLYSSPLERDDRFDIPIYVNDNVERWIVFFQTTGRKHFARWLERSGRYIPMMRKILRDNGLPEDLVYLSMIESGFNTAAYSRARASGPWQFISSTGKRYGLKVDWWIDERRDPEKSTIAAAQHLKDLYDQFQSWYLAYASYNAGAGKIDKAMRRYNTEDFWEITRGRYLKRETKNYVPKMIAAALIAKDPESYGFTDIQYEPPLAYDKAIVPEPTDLEVIAKAAGTQVEELRALNPELKRWFTPPNYPNYEIKLPVGTAQTFLTEYEKIKPAERLAFQYHRVTRRQSLSSIAKHYGISTEALMKFNGASQTRRLRPGTVLVIPLQGGAALAANQVPPPFDDERPARRRHPAARARAAAPPEAEAAPPPRSLTTSGDKTFYLVTSGDTLWSISRSFNVTVGQLRQWNKLRSGRRIQAGQKIVIYLPASGETPHPGAVKSAGNGRSQLAIPPRYVVRRGDTLWSIAQRFNVSVGELKLWNHLADVSDLPAGRELKVASGR